MSYLENSKTYTGTDLEAIFFRPMLTGSSAEELGIRVLYNMPIPTTIQLWESQRNVLQKFNAAGWSGTSGAAKEQKTIDMKRVKAEIGFSAADYFSMVYEKIQARPNVKMDELTGSDLEQAETELFRQSISEGVRATMWVGDASASTGFNTFDGILKSIEASVAGNKLYNTTYAESVLSNPESVIAIFDDLLSNSDQRLRDLKSEGHVAFYVTSDIYHLYEKYLDSRGVDAAYVDSVNGRVGLAYHGIPVVDLRINSYLADTSLNESFCMLTDRRNLVLAVNTADAPGNEIRMWYNPDEMENRQRAVFMAGCSVLDEALVGYAYKA